MNVVHVRGPRGKLVHLVPERQTLMPLWESLCGIESKYKEVDPGSGKLCEKCEAKKR